MILKILLPDQKRLSQEDTMAKTGLIRIALYLIRFRNSLEWSRRIPGFYKDFQFRDDGIGLYGRYLISGLDGNMFGHPNLKVTHIYFKEIDSQKPKQF